MFEDLKEGKTHYQDDQCGEPAHNQKTDQQKHDNLIYSIGVRDGMANVLAECNKKIKLPLIADQYKEQFKEEHFSHKWHTEI